MDSSARLYVQEVINFLNGIVIKFEPFESILNNKSEYAIIDGFDEYDKETFPYYRILRGDNAFATTPIYGYSPLSQGEILLTRENLQLYPDMRTFYRENDNLKLLLDRYPDDEFIIRRIVNPVVDISGAIDARNLTILTTEYTTSSLNSYEKNSIIFFLQEVLWRIEYRWYMSPMEYEDLYPHTFWSMLWSLLPLLVLTKRILNIKTVDVHPYHVWEYLASLGFGRYRGYLTHKQELFLYRNALYLKFHAGKQFLIDILGDVFLKPLQYSLSKKIIISHTLNREETHDKYPDVVPSNGSAEEYLSSTSFSSLLDSIYHEGHDTRNDQMYREGITSAFQKAPTNKLVTKFLEFDRNVGIDELMLLLRFILDSIVYLITQNKLMFAPEIRSPISQNTIRFDNVKDALALLFYCIYMQQEQPINLFTKYTLSTAISHLIPPTIPVYMYTNGDQYFVRSYVDVDEITQGIPYVTTELYSCEELSNALGSQYEAVFNMIDDLANTDETIAYEARSLVYHTLVPDMNVVDVPPNYATYVEYFERYPDALLEIDRITNDTQYNEFMYAIITGICPLEYGFQELARDDEIVSTLISKIKELFTYMVSYNITFLNKTFEDSLRITLPKLVGHIGESTGSTYTSYIGSLFDFSNDNIADYQISITWNGLSEISTDSGVDAVIEQVASTSQLTIELPDDDSSILSSFDNRIIRIKQDGISVTFPEQP